MSGTVITCPDSPVRKSDLLHPIRLTNGGGGTHPLPALSAASANVNKRRNLTCQFKIKGWCGLLCMSTDCCFFLCLLHEKTSHFTICFNTLPKWILAFKACRNVDVNVDKRKKKGITLDLTGVLSVYLLPWG